MNKRGAVAVVIVAAVLGLGTMPETRAASAPQIVDPALDHPVPWADLVGVELSIVKNKGRDFLQVTFTTSGEISDASRNVLTGYDFVGKVGSCELRVSWYAFPMATEPAGFPTGSAGAQCGATGKNVSGTYKFGGTAVTVQVPIQDFASKGVARGATMTNLTAHTALLEGLNGDDDGVLANTGDAAVGTKPWVLA